MKLRIDNQVIDAPIHQILTTLKSEIRGQRLRTIGVEVNDNIPIPCPVHKSGQERRPSCYVYCRTDNDNIEYGKCHCFTCGWTSSLPGLVSVCFGSNDIEVGERWLISKFGKRVDECELLLPELELPSRKKSSYIDESILDKYNYYHEYMWKRNLSKSVVDKFRIGYDNFHQAITFPVWDEHDRLVMVTSRSVISKQFYIEKNVDKPVYLLNFVKKEPPPFVVVVEGQIDALVSWSYGIPAVALFGSGTTNKQMNAINRSGIRHFVLMYDNDEAGRKGAERFKSLVSDDILVTDIIMPIGIDVGDCSKEQFINILIENDIINS